MKLEDQVGSLELSKRLKELGVKQESHFYWCVYSAEVGGNGTYFIRDKHHQEWNADCYAFTNSAFTVAELGEMLKNAKYNSGAKVLFPWYQASCDEWHDEQGWSQESTEADARAKMLIHLIEQGLVKP